LFVVEVPFRRRCGVSRRKMSVVAVARKLGSHGRRHRALQVFAGITRAQATAEAHDGEIVAQPPT